MKLGTRSLTPILLLAALGPVGLGCGSSGGAHRSTSGSAAESRAQTTLYRGEEIYRGLFFNSGPVAKLFPEVWERAQKAREAAKKSPPSETLTRVKAELAALPEGEHEMNPATITKMNHVAERIGKLPVEERAAATPALQSKLQRILIGMVRSSDPTFFARFGNDLQGGNQLKVDAALHEATTKTLDALAKLSRRAAKTEEGACGGCGGCGASCGGGGGSCGGGQGSCGGGQGSCGGGQGSCGGGQGSCGGGQGSCGGGQGSCGGGQGSCGGGQGSCGQGGGSCGANMGGQGDAPWYSATNFVWSNNSVALNNYVAVQNVAAAWLVLAAAAAVVWVAFADPTPDSSGLAPNRKLEREMFVNAVAKRLHVS